MEATTEMIVKKKKRVKQSKAQTTVFALYFVLFCVNAFMCIYPLFWCVCNSLKSVEEYYESAIALPKNWAPQYYLKIFQSFKIGYDNFWNLAFNSVWQAFGSQFLNIMASVFVAYPLARYNFPGKGFFYGLIVFVMIIPIIGSGAAAYKMFRSMNFINNPLGFATTWFMGFDMSALILYGYFKGISKEYSEAAYIDGATRIRTLFSIVLPQAIPCILALFVNNVMKQWNNYTTPMLYLTKYPNLALGIYLFESESLFIEGGVPMFFGAVVLSSLVPLALFTVGQKTMINSMSVGGLKG